MEVSHIRYLHSSCVYHGNCIFFLYQVLSSHVTPKTPSPNPSPLPSPSLVEFDDIWCHYVLIVGGLLFYDRQIPGPRQLHIWGDDHGDGGNVKHVIEEHGVASSASSFPLHIDIGTSKRRSWSTPPILHSRNRNSIKDQILTTRKKHMIDPLWNGLICLIKMTKIMTTPQILIPQSPKMKMMMLLHDPQRHLKFHPRALEFLQLAVSHTCSFSDFEVL